MRRLTMVLVMAAALGLPPSLSLADDERERIEAAVVSFLQGGEGAAARVPYGDVQVTAEDESYRVRISELKAIRGDGTAELMGDVSFRVRKVADDYAFDQVVLPARIQGVLRPSDLAPVEEGLQDYELETSASWGSVTLSGLWSPELQLPIDLDLEVADFLLEVEPHPADLVGLPEQQQFQSEIGRLSLSLQTDRNSKTDWDSTLRVSLHSVASTWPDLNIGNALADHDVPGFPKAFLVETASDLLSLTVEMTGFNPRTYARLGPSLDGYLDALDLQDADAVTEAQDDILALDRIFRGLLVTWRTRALTYEEMWPGGIVYRESQDGRFVTDAPAGKDELRIAYIGELDGSAERRPGVGAFYALRDDVQGNPTASAYFAVFPFTVMLEGLIPQRSSISLVVDGLPLAETSKLLLSAFGNVAMGVAETGTAAPADRSKSAPFDIHAWLTALDRAPTRISLERLSLSGAAYWLEGTADLSVDGESTSGVVGEAELVLSDLDEAQRLLRDRVEALLGTTQGGATSEGPLGAAIAMGVTMVKGLGEPKVEDGEIVYGYDFDVPLDGPATLNGRPLSDLLGP